jgi:hypothetical protein
MSIKTEKIIILIFVFLMFLTLLSFVIYDDTSKTLVEIDHLIYQEIEMPDQFLPIEL